MGRREGQVAGAPLKGHTDWGSVCCVSPDGKYIISRSHDHGPHMGCRNGAGSWCAIQGHTNRMASVPLLPDGKRFCAPRLVSTYGTSKMGRGFMSYSKSILIRSHLLRSHITEILSSPALPTELSASGMLKWIRL